MFKNIAKIALKGIALDCMFLVEFDAAGKGKVFREWRHSQTL
jgi:hypothetical protein